ncbi:unnamed protein product [Parnassius mnemosyne]|uniref:C2H2-type domain-containing protein n=1 Tax=Parnassius mnemosyne TaxID=213953 RepID=A0AAV1KI99_9NEOP
MRVCVICKTRYQQESGIAFHKLKGHSQVSKGRLMMTLCLQDTKMGFWTALAVNIVGAAVIYGTAGLAVPLIAPLLGFSSSGIVAESAAAAAQSYYGNLAPGVLFPK